MTRGGVSPARKRVLDRLRDDLGDYVASRRGMGRTWPQIAKMTGKAEADLRAAFDHAEGGDA